MAITAITAKSLKAGMNRWRKRFKGEKDFHNTLYRWLAETNKEGIFCENWDIESWRKPIFQELRQWQALRSSRKMKKLDDPEFWGEFKAIADTLREEMGGRDIASKGAAWGLCEPLFKKAHKLKPVRPPTFPAKLCHFVFPALFPVSDLKLVKIADASTYPDYWGYARGCWQHADIDRSELRDILRAEITKHSDLFRGYPFACKITELHVIGVGGYPACRKG